VITIEHFDTDAIARAAQATITSEEATVT